MNWLNILLRALSLVPATVSAVQVIAGENASGASKKDMALTAIQIGSGVAQSQLSMEDAQKAAAVTSIVSQTIDANVAHQKEAGTLGTILSGAAAAAQIASVIKG